jgi:hypothetical protein
MEAVMNDQEYHDLLALALEWRRNTCATAGVLDDCGDPECEAGRDHATQLMTVLNCFRRPLTSGATVIPKCRVGECAIKGIHHHNHGLPVDSGENAV